MYMYDLLITSLNALPLSCRRLLGARPLQGPTNTVPGRPGQAENFTGQVFCFLKKPAGLWRFTDELFCVIC